MLSIQHHILGFVEFFIENGILYFKYEKDNEELSRDFHCGQDKIMDMTEFPTSNVRIIDDYLYCEEEYQEDQTKCAIIFNLKAPLILVHQTVQVIDINQSFSFEIDNGFVFQGHRYRLTNDFVDNELYELLYPGIQRIRSLN